MAYAFFGLLALAALTGIINSFRDDNDRNVPAQPETDHEPRLYYPAPPARYDYPQRYYRDHYPPRKPVWSPVIFLMIFIGGVMYLISDKNNPVKGTHATVIGADTVRTAPPRTTRMDIMSVPVYPAPPPAEILPSSKVVQPDKEPFFVNLGVFNREESALVAAEEVNTVLKNNDRFAKCARTNLGRWMVYIPVATTREGAFYEAVLQEFRESLRPFCPAQPTTESYLAE